MKYAENYELNAFITDNGFTFKQHSDGSVSVYHKGLWVFDRSCLAKAKAAVYDQNDYCVDMGGSAFVNRFLTHCKTQRVCDLLSDPAHAVSIRMVPDMREESHIKMRKKVADAMRMIRKTANYF